MAKISTGNARSQLAPRGNPYYASIGEELDLGYRKNEKGGKWVARRYSGAANTRARRSASPMTRARSRWRPVLASTRPRQGAQWGGLGNGKDNADYTVAEAMAD